MNDVKRTSRISQENIFIEQIFAHRQFVNDNSFLLFPEVDWADWKVSVGWVKYGEQESLLNFLRWWQIKFQSSWKESFYQHTVTWFDFE